MLGDDSYLSRARELKIEGSKSFENHRLGINFRLFSVIMLEVGCEIHSNQY